MNLEEIYPFLSKNYGVCYIICDRNAIKKSDKKTIHKYVSCLYYTR